MTKTIGDIVREYFPDADEKFIEYVIWTYTGYPAFWRTDNPEAEMRQQLQEFKQEVGKVDDKK